MKRLTKKWESILDLDVKKEDNPTEIIRHAIKKAIVHKFIALSDHVPAHRVIAEHMGLDKGVIARVIYKLRVEDRLVVTAGRNGTKIVSHLPNKRGPSKGSLDEVIVTVPTEIVLFDQDTVMQNNRLTKTLDNYYNKAVKKFGKLNTKEREVESFSNLTKEITKRLNKTLKISFTDAMVHYAEGYRASINLICITFLPPKMFIVVASPVKKTVIETLTEVTSRVAYLKSDDYGISLDALDELCRQKKVGIVYFNSRISCPFGYQQLPARIDRLLAMQEQYGFIILEDDRNAGFYEYTPNLLMQQAAGKNAKIVYCSPLTISHPRLNRINMFSAPEKMTAKLSEKANKTGLVLDAVTACALEEILKSGVLERNDLLVRKATKITNTLTRAFLQNSGQWRAEGYSYNKGWLFHLMPLKGYLPKNIHFLLADAGFEVIDLSMFDSEPEMQIGVLISMAAHLGNDDGAGRYLHNICTFLNYHNSFNQSAD